MPKLKKRRLFRICNFCQGKGKYTLGLNASVSCTQCKKLRVVEFEKSCEDIDEMLFATEHHLNHAVNLVSALHDMKELLATAEAATDFAVYKAAVDGVRRLVEQALPMRNT